VPRRAHYFAFRGTLLAAVQPVQPRLTLDGSHHAMSAHRDTRGT
jgi:hypothetical protein